MRLEIQAGTLAILAAALTGVALAQGDTLLAWGFNNNGQINVPVGLTGVIEVATGGADDTGAADVAGTPNSFSAADWSSIRQAYDAGRHAVVVDGCGHRAWSPSQQWTTRFDGRGFEVTPKDGDWSWGLQLIGWGRVGAERPVAGHAAAHIEGNRLSCAWEGSLSEWYVNDVRGLEHGFTVSERPAGLGDLVFTLAVRGDLCPEIQFDGLGARFVGHGGTTVLTYSGLLAFDVNGRRLPVLMESTAEGLRLRVDDDGSRYPLTIDPLSQQAYLKASNTGAQDEFGGSVAAFGDTVVVGAARERSNATGVNGNQADNSLNGAGAAYVFVRDGNTWVQQAYLKASNTGAPDSFGRAVAISGDTIVVGAPYEASNATGVNGNQADNSTDFAGAAYVFTRSGNTWAQQAYLKASNTGIADSFGYSVAVSGDTVVVGAHGESSSATGVDGQQLDDSALRAGAAYVFVRRGMTWSQQSYLKASNTDAEDHFGWSVSLSGDTLVVGAHQEDSGAQGVNGDATSNSRVNSGAAYIFARAGDTWHQQAYVKASNTDAGDFFGFSVAISGDTMVVTAPNERSSATGVNGDQANNSAGASGAAYVFIRQGSVWSQQAYLKASNTEAGDIFGYSASVSGDNVVVSAEQESSNATGVNGNQADNSCMLAGAAYVFVRDGRVWQQQAYLKASNPNAFGLFGESVAATDDMVVVGAKWENSSATGVNGDPSSTGAPSSGAVYVFALSALPPCQGDLDDDRKIDGADLGLLLGAWGACGGCAADLDSSGIVDGTDLGLLLGSWGACR